LAVFAPGCNASIRGFGVRSAGTRSKDADLHERNQMPILWILVVVLVIFAVAGGVAVNNFLWLVLVVALILALAAMLSGRRTV
jgi:hypothetical protein